VSNLKQVLGVFGVIILLIILIVGGTFLGFFDTWFTNKVDYVNQKIEDRTNYSTRKKVEDTCRSMIASYKTDKSTYDMYKESNDSEKQSWGEQAKMRANKTANIYNEYILKNSYVFDGNIPSDIVYRLEILQ